MVFMDIQMPGLDGFGLLQKLDNIPFHLIFTTAYDQHAIRAIRFSAIDYLLKPIGKMELGHAIGRVINLGPGKENAGLEELKRKSASGRFFDKLAIPTLSEIVFIPLNDIIYMESENNYTVLHTSQNGTIVSSKNIGYYEELLEELNFFRIHNSYMINLKKIKRYIRGKEGLIEMEDSVKLPVSKRRKEEFLEYLSLI